MKAKHQIVELNNGKFALQEAKFGLFTGGSNWEFIHKSPTSPVIMTFDTVAAAREFIVDPMAVKSVVEVL